MSKSIDLMTYMRTQETEENAIILSTLGYNQVPKLPCHEFWNILMGTYKTVQEYNRTQHKSYRLCQAKLLPHGQYCNNNTKWWRLNKVVRSFSCFFLKSPSIQPLHGEP